MTVPSIREKVAVFLRRRWKLVSILAIVVVAGGLFYQRTQAQRAAENERTFVAVERGTLTKSLEISGVVDAKEKARMRFAAGGKVVYLPVQEGDYVEKYDTIATIDRATLNEQLDTELNNYLQQRWSWETTRDTYVEGGTNMDQPIPNLEDRRTVDIEQFKLNNAVNAVEIRNIAIRDTVLSAPFAGIVTSMPTSTTGVQLGITDYFELVNPDTLIFRAFVEEESVADLRELQGATVELDAFTDAPIDTTIEFISFVSATLNNSTVYPIELPLAGMTELPVRIGMNGDAQIIVDERADTLSIPLNATRERSGTTFVDVRISDTEVEERAIEIGLETDDRVEVLSGLSEGDEIVLPE